jgi:hypothetical protein
LMKNCVRSCCVVGCLQHSNAQGAFTPRCSCNEQADVPQLLPGPKPTLSPFLGLEPFLRNAGPPMHNWVAECHSLKTWKLLSWDKCPSDTGLALGQTVNSTLVHRHPMALASGQNLQDVAPPISPACSLAAHCALSST